MPRPNWIDDVVSIPDGSPLWRGIVVPDQIRRLADGNEVPALGALISHEVSVSIGSETTQEAVLQKGQARGVNWRLWEFTAGTARAAGCIVDRDPQADDPAHAVVLRADQPGRRLREAQAKNLITRGRWAGP